MENRTEKITRAKFAHYTKQFATEWKSLRTVEDEDVPMETNELIEKYSDQVIEAISNMSLQDGSSGHDLMDQAINDPEFIAEMLKPPTEPTHCVDIEQRATPTDEQTPKAPVDDAPAAAPSNEEIKQAVTKENNEEIEFMYNIRQKDNPGDNPEATELEQEDQIPEANTPADEDTPRIPELETDEPEAEADALDEATVSEDKPDVPELEAELEQEDRISEAEALDEALLSEDKPKEPIAIEENESKEEIEEENSIPNKDQPLNIEELTIDLDTQPSQSIVEEETVGPGIPPPSGKGRSSMHLLDYY